MKKYQATLHKFTETNKYEEVILARCAIDLNPVIEKIHDKYDMPVLLLPNNVEMHLMMLENLHQHITIEELQEVY